MSLDFTSFHCSSLDFTRFHWIACYLTWFHVCSSCFTIFNLISLHFTLVHFIQLYFSLFHMVSHLFMWFHFVSLYFTLFHFVSPGVTLFHLIPFCFAWFHFISLCITRNPWNHWNSLESTVLSELKRERHACIAAPHHAMLSHMRDGTIIRVRGRSVSGWCFLENTRTLRTVEYRDMSNVSKDTENMIPSILLFLCYSFWGYWQHDSKYPYVFEDTEHTISSILMFLCYSFVGPNWV